jgi:uncharacterized membrane protein
MNVLTAVGWLVLLTFLPGLEARASIPFAFFNTATRAALGLVGAVAVCFATNLAVGVATFWLMGPVVQVLRRWPWFERRVWPRFERTQHKLRPYVEKYGEWGLAVFIGVPLPGTGAYTGAFGAFLLGMGKRKFLVANALGVLIACVAVSSLCLLIDKGMVAEDSVLRRVFIKSLDAHE